MYKRMSGIVLLLLLLIVSGASAEQVNLGYVHVFDDAPVLVARDGGFYEANDLDVNVQAFTSGPNLIKGLINGQLDIGVLGFSNALTWVARGADLYIVGKVQNGYHALVTRADTGIIDLSQLKGKSVATQGVGSTADIVLKGVVLPAGNLKDTDLNLIYTAPATALQSLLAGRVDAAFLFEPFDTLLNHLTTRIELFEVGNTWPFPCMVIVVTGDFLQANGDTLENLLQVNKESIEYINQYPELAAKLLVPSFLSESSVGSAYGQTELEGIMLEAINSQTFDWRLSQEDIERMEELMEIMITQKVMPGPLDINSIIDLSWQVKLDK